MSFPIPHDASSMAWLVVVQAPFHPIVSDSGFPARVLALSLLSRGLGEGQFEREKFLNTIT